MQELIKVSIKFNFLGAISKVVCFLLLLLILHNQYTFSQTGIYWKQRYDSKSQYLEYIHDLKTDRFGNIYITGWSGGNGTDYDYVTIKYNSSGVQQWLARYNNISSNYDHDYANGLAIDDSGNVYVTGLTINEYLGNGFYNYGFLTIKYNSAGVVQWTMNYDSSGYPGAVSIAVDQSRNVYVLGTSSNGKCTTIKYNGNGLALWISQTIGEAVKLTLDNSGNILVGAINGNSFKTVKYNSNGLQQWVATFTTAGSYYDNLNDIACDRFGNVFVTGSTYQNIPGDSYTTIKYNSSGVQQWVDIIYSESRGNALAVDSIGNSYVTGQFPPLCYTVKYDTGGSKLWERMYSYVMNGDYGSSICIDNNLNVYVTGTSWGPSLQANDMNTIKYNSNGIQQWVVRYNGPVNSYDQGEKIVCLDSNYVVVAGETTNDSVSYDYGVVKYSTSGVQQWAQVYAGPPINSEYPKSMLVDDSGNVYVSGFGGGNESFYDFLTIKYNSTGTQQWVNRYDGPAHDTDLAYSMCSDLQGNIYVTGGSKGLGSNYDYATVKYNSSGLQQWVARFNGLGNGDDVAKCIVSDSLNNIYITGKSYAGASDYDYVTIKYNSLGVEQWVARYNGNGNGTDEANAIVVDNNGNIYVTGKSIGSGTSFDCVTIKYSSSGLQQWVARYNGSGNGDDEVNAITLDHSGNLYITGTSYGNGSDYDCITIKYNSTGVQQWVAIYNGSGNSIDESVGIKADKDNNIYITGSTKNIATDFDYVTIKYNSSGVQQWVQQYNGTGNGIDKAHSIAISDSGNVYITGESLGSGTGIDFATLKYNALGALSAIARFAAFSDRVDQGIVILTDKNENVYITGNSDNFSYNNKTEADFLTIKTSSNLTYIQIFSKNIPLSFFLSQNYPNPFNPTTKIKFDIPNIPLSRGVPEGQPARLQAGGVSVTLTIYDLLGREVATLVNQQLKPGTYEVDWDGSKYASGVYFYKLISGTYSESKRMILLK